MASSLTLVVILILKLCYAALAEQQIKFATQPNPVQCADENLEWTGGIPPFVVTISTTDDANVSSVTVAPNVQTRNYTWSPVDIPGGTPITIDVRSSAGDSVETNTINVQSSSNSSCLDEGETSPLSTTRTLPVPTASRTLEGTASSTSSSSIASGTSDTSSPSSNSHVAIIAGVVVGCLVLLALIVVLMMMQRRRDRRRNQLSSKQALVQTFGSAKADLDSAGDDDAESMAAVPEPYVYRAVSRSRSNLAIETEDLSRRPSSVRTDPVAPARSPGAARRSPQDSARSPATPATRKGERYLPNYANSPQEFSPGGVSSGRSGIQEEDIDRLAARMVAMMSSGRISEQAWTPGGGGPGGGAVDEEEAAMSPPPMYKDIARSGGRPREW